MKLQRLKGIAATAVMTTALGTAMLVTVPQAYADDHGKCQRQIERAESKLDQAIASMANAATRLSSAGEI